MNKKDKATSRVGIIYATVALTSVVGSIYLSGMNFSQAWNLILTVIFVSLTASLWGFALAHSELNDPKTNQEETK